MTDFFQQDNSHWRNSCVLENSLTRNCRKHFSSLQTVKKILARFSHLFKGTRNWGFLLRCFHLNASLELAFVQDAINFWENITTEKTKKVVVWEIFFLKMYSNLEMWSEGEFLNYIYYKSVQNDNTKKIWIIIFFSYQ